MIDTMELPGEDRRAEGALLAATALALVLGLQLVRVFLPLATFYLYDALGLPPLATAAISLAVFLIALAAPALARRLGWRRALRLTAAGMAVLRMAEQLSRSPAVDVWLGAAGTALFAALVALLLLGAARPLGRRTELAFTVVLALAAETAIRTLAGTLDLSWQAGTADLLVLALAGGALLAAGRRSSATGPPAAIAARPWGWLALGAWLAIYLLVYSNPAQLAARSGMPLTRASWFVLGGWLAGLAAAAFGTLNGPSRWRTLEASALAAVGTWMAVFGGDDAWFGILIGTPGMAVLLFELLATSPRRLVRGSASGTAGVVLLASLYLVYGRFDQPFGPGERAIYLAALGALVAPCLAIAWRARPERWLAAWRPWLAGALVALAVAGAGTWLLAPCEPPAPAAAAGPVRVLTYNLHQGFSTSGRLDPEALAREIEAEAPDVVALQEVARGWLVTGGLDLFDGLARRLGMSGVFAGTADPQWGNAVLTRLPIVAGGYHPLPPDELPLRRGALDVTVATGDGPLRLLCIHFHHRRGADAVRRAQTEALLGIWDGSPATVLLGDFNALPTSDAIGDLRAAGLHDAAALLPPGERFTITREGDRQIDWIFATPDLAFEATRVRFTESSDHLPLATTVHRRAAAASAIIAPQGDSR